MANPPAAVVFDLDGTLLDTAPDLAGALNRLLADEGLPPLALGTVREIVGEGAVRMIERGLAAAGAATDGPLDADLRRRFLDHYRACMTERTRPFPGAVRALEELSAKGRPLAICTNKSHGFSAAILAELGLEKFFGALIGGDSLATNKPDPAPLHAAIAGVGGTPERAVMIGDSITDVGAARAAGVPVIVVSFGYTSIAPRALGADAVIDHFDELLPALAAIEG
ncbi:MAG: phosphoglycolate phosphatase [Alphaproteobacteria bacterium]|jgi:phosphoglycolate phosphatase|nr:phosphoglycolate phosphatase [Alphaproteobacteria bacterium]